MVDVSGTVYKSSGYSANSQGQCVNPTGPGVNPNPGQSRIELKNTNGGAIEGSGGVIQASGNYQVSQVPLSTGPVKQISLLNIGSGWSFVCPAGGGYPLANVDPAGGGITTGWDVFVSDVVAKWAQVIGGHVHGQTGATVAVPAANYLMIPASFTNNPGAATKTSGNITTFPGSLSATNWNLTDALSQSSWRYSYQRLWVRAGSPSTDPGDGSTRVPDPGIYRKTGDYRVNSGGWQNLSGSRVIFVDGNLEINYRVTLAGANDFLAFIVSGDINVDPAVGDTAVASPVPAQADLVGAFLAEGDFNAGSNSSQPDKQLVIYGTIGADIDLGINNGGRVNFQRDMGANNSVGPGVAVIWNTNLLLNWPEQLSDALTDWREVAP